MAAFYPAEGRAFVPYDGFDNAHADGAAMIARLVGPMTSRSMGCGIASYRRVRTTWRLPFDEIIFIVSGAMTVRAGGRAWDVGPGDVLFFSREEPVEYDVAEDVTLFYAKYPLA